MIFSLTTTCLTVSVCYRVVHQERQINCDLVESAGHQALVARLLESLFTHSEGVLQMGIYVNVFGDILS